MSLSHATSKSEIKNNEINRPTIVAIINLDDAGLVDYYNGMMFGTQSADAITQELTDSRPAAKLVLLSELGDLMKRQNIPSVDAIAVIYPELGEPFRSVFLRIIDGIEAQLKTKVRSYPVSAAVNAADLNVQLKSNGTRVVIALGRQGLAMSVDLDRDILVVAGAVLGMPKYDHRKVTGISMLPDPSLMFARLKELMPSVKRVTVVYDPKNNEWLINLARDAARSLGLELVAKEARDLTTAARLYEAFFASAEGQRDAIWLPQDATTVDEATIVPLILKESWDRSVPFFSSNFLHVKRGALFALYPNNTEMGRAIANHALGVLGGDPGKTGVLPLRELLAALNLRTAAHFGLILTEQQKRTFDVIVSDM